MAKNLKKNHDVAMLVILIAAIAVSVLLIIFPPFSLTGAFSAGDVIEGSSFSINETNQSAEQPVAPEEQYREPQIEPPAIKNQLQAEPEFTISDVSDCQNITSSGVYVLAQNITGNQSSGRCIDVQAADVTLDCLNIYSITGNEPGTTYGIYTNSSNTTIQNCNITNYSRGIQLQNSDYPVVNNNEIYNCTQAAITHNFGNDSNFTNNEIYNIGTSGNGFSIIYVGSGQNNIIENNILFNNSGYAGIESSNANHTQIINNTVTYTMENGIGIDINNAINNTITNNTANHNKYYGISIETFTYNHTLINNTANYNNDTGIVLWQSNYSNLIDNTASNNLINGFWLFISSHNTFINNSASNNTQTDFNTTSTSVKSENNTVINLTTHQNIVSFKLLDATIKGLMPSQAPTDPSNYINISKWINATNQSGDSWLFLNVSYVHGDLGSVTESTLRMAKHNGSWKTNPNSFTGGTYGINTISNYVYANITNFGSIFAPMGIVGSEAPDCMNITSEGIYQLTQNLTGNQSHGICIDIQSDNVTLDCLDTFSINGNESNTIGVYSNKNNVTVQNCYVQNYAYGIEFNSNSNNSIINNTAEYNLDGIYLYQSDNNTVANNTVNKNADGMPACGIHLYTSSYNNIDNNAAYKNSNAGIYVGSFSSFNNITNNTLTTNLPYGIHLFGNSNNNFLFNNTVYYSAEGIFVEIGRNEILINNTLYYNSAGINITSCTDSEITKNNAYNNTEDGIIINESINNNITYNTVYNNSNYGIRLWESSTYNNVADNIIDSNENYGIHVFYSSYNNITNNSVNRIGFNGIFVESSNNIDIIDNTVNYSGADNIFISNVSYANIINNTADNVVTAGYNGISIFDVCYYNNITNNTVDSNTGSGIYFYSSDNNTIIGNTIRNNTEYGTYVRVGSDNNIFNNNTAYQNILSDIGIENSENNTFTNQTLAGNNFVYPTTIDFTNQPLSIVNLKGVTNPPVNPAYRNISKYVNITVPFSTWLFLNVSYETGDIAGVIESTLRIVKNNGTWKTNPNSFTGGTYGINTISNYVYANITNFGSIFAPFGIAGAGAAPICMNITTEGHYILTENLTGNQSHGICIDIQSDNVTLNCGGFDFDGFDTFGITGNQLGTTYGIYSNSTNTTIENCYVQNYTYGIYLNSSNQSTLFSNAINNNMRYGIFTNDNLDCNLTDNTVNSNSVTGIGLNGSSNNTVANNIISNNTGTGIGLNQQSNNNTLFNNTENQSNYGIIIRNSTDNNLINNSIDNNNYWDFYSQLDSLDNIATNFATLQNIISFDSKDIALKGLASAGAPSEPANYRNISKYINATNISADSWLFLNVSYETGDIGGLNESALRIAKHNGIWYTDPAAFANTYNVSTADNYVYANITSFGSIFAPLIEQNTSTCSLTIGPPSPVTYPTNVFANCSCINPEDTGTLYRNNTDVTVAENGTATLVPKGFWEYECNNTQTENYTSASNTTTYTVQGAAGGTAPIVVRGGIASEPVIIYNCSIKEGQSEQFELRVGDSIDCVIRGELHNIRLAEILDTQHLAEFEVASPFRIALATSQTYYADVDDSGLNDTAIKLVKFALPRNATIILSLLKEVAPVIPTPPAPTPPPAVAAGPPYVLMGMIVLLALILITAGYHYFTTKAPARRRRPAIAITKVKKAPPAIPELPELPEIKIRMPPKVERIIIPEMPVLPKLPKVLPGKSAVQQRIADIKKELELLPSAKLAQPAVKLPAPKVLRTKKVERPGKLAEHLAKRKLKKVSPERVEKDIKEIAKLLR